MQSGISIPQISVPFASPDVSISCAGVPPSPSRAQTSHEDKTHLPQPVMCGTKPVLGQSVLASDSRGSTAPPVPGAGQEQTARAGGD